MPVEHTDETCPNCDSGVLKVTPDEGEGQHGPDASFICDPDTGCGMVVRYE